MEDLQATITLEEILQSLKKRWRLIVICTMTLAVAVTVVTLFFMKPKYETTTKVFVGKEQGTEESYSNSDVQMYKQLLKTYGEVIKTRDMAKAAIEESGLNLKVEEVRSKLSVVEIPDTQILQIKYVSTNPEEALEIINIIRDEFIETAVKLVPNGNVQVLEGATFPENPVSPNKKMNIAIAVLLGLMLGIGTSLMLEFLGNTFKTKEELERELEIPTLGIIPDFNRNI